MIVGWLVDGSVSQWSVVGWPVLCESVIAGSVMGEFNNILKKLATQK